MASKKIELTIFEKSPSAESLQDELVEVGVIVLETYQKSLAKLWEDLTQMAVKSGLDLIIMVSEKEALEFVGEGGAVTAIYDMSVSEGHNAVLSIEDPRMNSAATKEEDQEVILSMDLYDTTLKMFVRNILIMFGDELPINLRLLIPRTLIDDDDQALAA